MSDYSSFDWDKARIGSFNLQALPPAARAAFFASVYGPGSTSILLPPDVDPSRITPEQIREALEMAGKTKKTKTNTPASVPKAASNGVESGDSEDLPPLEAIPSDKKKPPTSSTSKPKPSSTSCKTTGVADESDDDMPPLTTGPSASSSAQKPKEVEIKDVEFSKGTKESLVYDWEGLVEHGEPNEGGAGGKAVTKKAYELLGWKASWGDEEIVKKALPIMAAERSCQASGKSTSTRLGAVLIVICSRSSPLNTTLSSPESGSIAHVLRLLYLCEAQLHLTGVRLPLPPGAEVPSDIDFSIDTFAAGSLEAEKAAHGASKKELQESQMRAEQATSGATAARTKAEKAEQEVRSLRGELDKLRVEKEELKAQAKDGWAEKGKVGLEVEEVKAECRRYKREVQDAKDEGDRLRRHASRTPTFSLSPSTASANVPADKKDFVIQRLSRQVNDLSSQLRAKNEELLQLLASGAEVD